MTQDLDQARAEEAELDAAVGHLETMVAFPNIHFNYSTGRDAVLVALNYIAQARQSLASVQKESGGLPGVEQPSAPDFRTIALGAMKDAHRTGESNEMCARWIAQRICAALASVPSAEWGEGNSASQDRHEGQQADAVQQPAPSLERRLAQFFRECVQMSWEGMDIDGGDIQEMAVGLGLCKVVPYDPEIHAGYSDDVDPGDDWYTYADGVLDLVHGVSEPPAQTASAVGLTGDDLNLPSPPTGEA